MLRESGPGKVQSGRVDATGAPAVRPARFQGETVPTTGRSSQFFARSALFGSLAALALSLSASSAAAQNFFDALFGRRANPAPSANAYADPFSQWNPFGQRAPEAPRPETLEGDGVAYCVRLCDGRFFPVQRQSNVTPAQTCSAFCPASQTRIYNGGTIDQAVGPDGRPYRELATAFVYREKTVAGCTCNGKDAFGLVNTPIAEDATLRPGDIVATNAGLMAYNGGTKRQASFTPVASYSGISSDLRRKLTETKIAPETPAPQVKQSDVKQSDSSRSNVRSKRTQAER
jgi:hypothetical protein